MITDRKMFLDTLLKSADYLGLITNIGVMDNEPWEVLEGYHLARVVARSGRLFVSVTDGASWITAALQAEGTLNADVPIVELLTTLREVRGETICLEQSPTGDLAVRDPSDDAPPDEILMAPGEDDGEFQVPPSCDWARLVALEVTQGVCDSLEYLSRVATPRDSGAFGNKAHLAQVLFDPKYAFLTDGHRMHVIPSILRAVDTDRSIRVDLDTFLFVVDRCTVGSFLSVDVFKDFMRWRVDNWSIICSTPAAAPPDYRGVVPSGTRQSVVVDVSDFAHVLTAIAGDPPVGNISLRLRDNLVRLYAHDPESHDVTGSQYVDVFSSSDVVQDYNIGILGKYVLDSLGSDGLVQLTFAVEPSPGVKALCFRNAAGLRSVVMPVMPGAPGGS